MNFEKRSHQAEQLDNLSLSGKVLQQTLLSLRHINLFLGNHRQLSSAVIKFCLTRFPQKKISIIDIGCGGGDSLFYISKKLKARNINASLMGIDGNPQSIAYAQQNNPDPSNIAFRTADILASDFNLPICDVVISSHFIYHFNDQQLCDFLKKLQTKTVKHIIFSELYRSAIAYYIFKLVSTVLPISEMAKKDGLIAIRRAFTRKELLTIIKGSEIEKYTVIKKPFFRMIAQIYICNERNSS
ncbi:methyltransferase domain-containing protein [Aquimarina pacifica]|uniref:methyltransferase domain-containing protein n=1 Tax=Aquimarina pacifica TaxID=1296415 RepID=UPI000472836E|nr:methyltransferase domain-containing protein [Aquimarina pacifica]